MTTPGGDRESATTVIRADRLIDGGGGEPIIDPVIVIADGCIRGIFEREAPNGWVPPDSTVLDYPGCTLLPGLIDAHVHLNLPGDGSILEDLIGIDDGVLVAASASAARIALEAGITTVRDTGASRSTSFDLRQAIGLGYAVGPRMLLVGQPITITGGHTWYLGGEADGVEGVRLKVRQLCKQGADWIKVMGSGGGTLNTHAHRSAFRREELAAIADEAHRLERRVTVHTLCADALMDAIAAGVDQIEHASFLVDGNQHQQFAPEAAERLAKAGIPVTSTLAVAYDMVETLSAKPDKTPQDLEALERWKRMLDDNLAQFTKLHEAGVRFVAGTDAGWRFTRFDGLPEELWLMVSGGMSASQAISAATGVSAEVLGIGDGVGRLRVGRSADVIATRGNPLDDIRHIAKVQLVVQSGEIRVAGGCAPRAGTTGRWERRV